MINLDDKKYYSILEISEKFGKGYQSIAKLIRDRKVPTYKFGSIFVLETDLHLLLKAK